MTPIQITKELKRIISYIEGDRYITEELEELIKLINK